MSGLSVIRREASEADQRYTSLCSPLPAAAARLLLSRDHLAVIDHMISTLTELSASASGLAHSRGGGGGGPGPTYLRAKNVYERAPFTKCGAPVTSGWVGSRMTNPNTNRRTAHFATLQPRRARSQIEESRFCRRRCLLQNNMMDERIRGEFVK